MVLVYILASLSCLAWQIHNGVLIVESFEHVKYYSIRSRFIYIYMLQLTLLCVLHEL